MLNDNLHIISSLQWNTSFGNMERAHDFQNDLSSWSHATLPNIITSIFDRLCPTDQTWTIRSLELDLGVVYHDTLDQDLTRKVNQELSNALRDLALYPNSTSNDIKFLYKDASHIELLRHFFMYGFFPWNQSVKAGSLHVILTDQLQKNVRDVIKMLEEIAIYPMVRKRIIWQTNDDTIQEIIKGLEPNNYRHIVHFHEQLTVIHGNGSIVGASTHVFKKNLWLCILDFLFEARKTLFNKVALLKSSLLKMANHHNLSYDELYQKIKESINNTNLDTRITSDFTLVFNLIPKAGPDIFQKNTSENEDALWNAFDTLLTTHKFQLETPHFSDINDLIIYLSRKDRQRFVNVILHHGTSRTFWHALVENLDDNTLETIFHTISPRPAKTLIDTVYFLDRLHAQHNINLNIKRLWELAITFLLLHLNGEFKTQDFLRYSVATICKYTNLSSYSYLEKILDADVASSLKTISSTSIYRGLVSAFSNEHLKTAPLSYRTNRFNVLLSSLIEYYESGNIQHAEFNLKQKLFVKWMRLYPTSSYNVLLGHMQKSIIPKLISHVFDEHDASFLLERSRKEQFYAFKTLQEAIVNLKEHDDYDSIIQFGQKGLMSIGLEVILQHPQGQVSTQTEQLLVKIFDNANLSNFNELELFFKELFNDEKLQGLSSMTAIPHDSLIRKILENHRSSPIASVLEIIDLFSDRQMEVSRLLIKDDQNNPLQYQKLLSNKEGKGILDYLMNHGHALAHKVIDEYSDIRGLINRKGHLNDQRQDISHVIWKCFIDYAKHTGNASNLRSVVKQSIADQFPDQEGFDSDSAEFNTSIKTDHPDSVIINDRRLGITQLFNLVERGLVADSMILQENGVSFKLDELIRIGLKTSPDSMLRIMNKIKLSKKQILILSKSTSYDQFTVQLASSLDYVTSETIFSIKLMLYLIKKVGTSKQFDALLPQYWTHTMKIILGSNNSDRSMSALLKATWQALSEGHVTIELFLEALKDHRAVWSRKFMNALVELNASLPETLIVPLKNQPSKALLRSNENDNLENLCYHIIAYNSLPYWFSEHKEIGPDHKSVIKDIAAHYPIILFRVLKNRRFSGPVLSRFHQMMDIETLLGSIVTLLPENQHQCQNVKEIYSVLDHIQFDGVAAKDAQNMLFKQMIKVWISNTWERFSSEHIWNDLIWELCTQRGLSKSNALQAIKGKRAFLSPSLKLSLDIVTAHDSPQNAKKEWGRVQKSNSLTPKPDPAPVSGAGIPVENAGLVLLNNYIGRLLNRLDLVENDNFKTFEHQLDAIHYLQFLVTGYDHTEESFLPLNKVLCGIHPTHPVLDGVELSQDDKGLIHGLIEAVCQHWGRIGSTSVNGFRGNWLVRKGVLKEQEDRWELTVEKKAYDLLLNEAPFSFSIIKFPWMDKPLHVRWDY